MIVSNILEKFDSGSIRRAVQRSGHLRNSQRRKYRLALDFFRASRGIGIQGRKTGNPAEQKIPPQIQYFCHQRNGAPGSEQMVPPGRRKISSRQYHDRLARRLFYGDHCKKDRQNCLADGSGIPGILRQFQTVFCRPPAPAG